MWNRKSHGNFLRCWFARLQMYSDDILYHNSGIYIMDFPESSMEIKCIVMIFSCPHRPYNYKHCPKMSKQPLPQSNPPSPYPDPDVTQHQISSAPSNDIQVSLLVKVNWLFCGWNPNTKTNPGPRNITQNE
jgi:hypothetical protein